MEGSDPVFRENLVVLDEECHLYHVVVKGLHVRDGKEVNSQVFWSGNGQDACVYHTSNIQMRFEIISAKNIILAWILSRSIALCIFSGKRALL